MAKTTVRRRSSNAGRGKGLAPMNGMAGAGMTCGIFALCIALFGWTIPFFVTAAIVAVFALGFSARGKAMGSEWGRPSKISIVGLSTGGLALLIALVRVIFR
jgi:hypothetical protein